MARSRKSFALRSAPSKGTSRDCFSSTESTATKAARASVWQSQSLMSAARISFLLLAAIALSLLVACQHKPTSVPAANSTPSLKMAVKPATSLPFLICAVYPGTTRMVASCGPDPNNYPVPCAHIDGSFIVAPGGQIKFGILNANGIQCDVQTTTSTLQPKL